MTFIYKLDPYSLKISRRAEVSMSRLSKVIILRAYMHTYIHVHTDRQTYKHADKCHQKHYHAASRVYQNQQQTRNKLYEMRTCGHVKSISAHFIIKHFLPKIDV